MSGGASDDPGTARDNNNNKLVADQSVDQSIELKVTQQRLEGEAPAANNQPRISGSSTGKYCVACGASIPAHGPFCGSCGEKQ